MKTLECAFAGIGEMGCATCSHISPCESVWYTAGLPSRFFFFKLKAGDPFSGKGIPTILPSLCLLKSFSLRVQLLGDEGITEIH